MKDPVLTGRRVEASEFLIPWSILLLAKVSMRLQILTSPVTVHKAAMARNSFETHIYLF